ncbi:MAG: exo-alpha-sialidase [Opitutaceae bacterium]|nr:exo-alpha-sialidase [Opitutaceae bacterium]
MKTRLRPLGLALAALLAWPALAAAGLKVEVLDTVKIHESRRYGYFPSLQQLSTGELICDFSLNADTDDIEGSFWGYVVSTDGGRTWGMRYTGGCIYREAAYTRDPALPDGSLLMVAGYPLPGPGDDYRNLRATSCRLSDQGRTARYAWDVGIRLPQPAARVKMDVQTDNFAALGPGRIKEAAVMLFSGTMVPARDGGWLTAMYGKFEGDRGFRTLIVRSGAAGQEWDYVGTVAGDEQTAAALAREGEPKSEGFCEPRMVRLPDGRLFIVMRRGSNNRMYRSWSDDEGRTWSDPDSLGFRGVEPAMMVMRDGTLALSTGRPDAVSVRCSVDGGQTWTDPTPLTRGLENPRPGLAHASQKSTCYTGLVEVEPGRLLVVYDHLPFVEGWGLNPANEPAALNTIYGTFVQVTR